MKVFLKKLKNTKKGMKFENEASKKIDIIKL